APSSDAAGAAGAAGRDHAGRLTHLRGQLVELGHQAGRASGPDDPGEVRPLCGQLADAFVVDVDDLPGAAIFAQTVVDGGAVAPLRDLRLHQLVGAAGGDGGIHRAALAVEAVELMGVAGG